MIMAIVRGMARIAAPLEVVGSALASYQEQLNNAL
jgi:hypothetical protein